MTIAEIVRQGFHYALTCRSLWLFGFFVGIATGGSNGGSGGGSGGHGSAVGAGAAAAGAFALSLQETTVIVGVILLTIAVGFVMRFVGEGALIEGIVRVRQGGTMTTRDGFRAGWAHWGVLVRIALLYVAATAGSLVLLAAPCVLAWQVLGPVAGVALAIPALLIAVPWLVTLTLVQAFAWRIAVLENRRAIDAIRKARLFLHGRLVHALKLAVATFLGTLGFGVLGFVAIVPVLLVLVASTFVVPIPVVIAIGCVVLIPAFCVFTAMVGTFRSSIWTIGYVSQVEA